MKPLGNLIRLVGRVVFWAVLVLVLFSLMLQIPAVQTRLIRYLSQDLTARYGNTFRIGQIHLHPWKGAVLQDLYLSDTTGDTLVYARQISAGFQVSSFLMGDLTIDEVALEDARIRLHQLPDSSMNYAFLVEYFSDTATTDTAEGPPVEFLIKQVAAENLDFSYRAPGQTITARAAELETEISDLGTASSRLVFEDFLASQLHVDLRFAGDSAQPEPSEEAAATTGELPPLNPSGMAYQVKHFEVEKSSFALHQGQSPEHKGFSPSRFALEDFHAELDDFLLEANYLRVAVRRLRLREKYSGFALSELDADLQMNNRQFWLDLQDFRTPHSELDEDLLLELPDYHAGDAMLQKLRAHLHAKQDSLAMKDLAPFVPALDSLPALRREKLYLNGDFQLARGHFRLGQGQFRLGNKLYLSGNGLVERIHNPRKMAVDFRLDTLQTSGAALAAFWPGQAPEGLAKAGQMGLSGQVSGPARNLTARLALGTEVGRMQLSGGLQADSLFEQIRLQGQGKFRRIALGQILQNPELGRLSADAVWQVSRSPKGKWRLDSGQAHLKQLQAGGMLFQGLRLKALRQGENYRGKMSYQDEKLAFDLSGSYQGGAVPGLQIQGEVGRLRAQKLGLTGHHSDLAFRLEGGSQFPTAEKAEGFLAFRDIRAATDDWQGHGDSLVLRTFRKAGRRHFSAQSDDFQGQLQTTLAWEKLPAMTEAFLAHFRDKTASTRVPVDTTARDPLQFRFRVQEHPVLLPVFVPGLQIEGPIEMAGRGDFDRRQVDFTLQSEKITYQGLRYHGGFLELKSSPQDYQLTLRWDSIQYGERIHVPQPRLLLDGQPGKLRWQLALNRRQAPSWLDWRGTLRFAEQQAWLKIDSNAAQYDHQPVGFQNPQAVQVWPGFRAREGLHLQVGQGQLSLSTQQESDGPLYLLAWEKLPAGALKDALLRDSLRLGGLWNGELKLRPRQEDFRAHLRADWTDLLVDSLALGEWNIEASYSQALQQASFATDFRGKQHHLTGYGTFDAEKTAFHSGIALHKLDLKVLAPYLDPALQQYSGKLAGDWQVAYSPEAGLRFPGELRVLDTAFVVPQKLAKGFRVPPQQVLFEGQSLQVENFTLLDAEGRKLRLSGQTAFLQGPEVDLRAHAQDFELFEIPEFQQPKFYGALRSGMDLHFSGQPGRWDLEGQIRTGQGTNIHWITDESGGEVQQSHYVDFVDLDTIGEDVSEETLEQEFQEKMETGLTGLASKVTIKVEPEAQLNLYIDSKNGDRISTRGSAELELITRRSGQLILEGNYTVKEASYELRVFQLFKRKFHIAEGSQIRWRGSPANPRVAMEARYTTRAAPAPLLAHRYGSLDNSQTEALQVKRPIDVVMDISGRVMEPELSFAIEQPSNTGIEQLSLLKTELQALQKQPTELNRQVFGLVAMGRFLPPESARSVEDQQSGGGSPYLDNSLSNFLTGQLNNLSDSYLSGLQFSLDIQDTRPINSGDRGEFIGNQMDWAVSKNFFNDRLKVKLGGAFAIDPSAQNQSFGGGQAASRQFGNVTVEYRLDKGGHYHLRFFRNHQQGSFSTSQSERYGATIQYSKHFNEFRQLSPFRKEDDENPQPQAED